MVPPTSSKSALWWSISKLFTESPPRNWGIFLLLKTVLIFKCFCFHINVNQKTWLLWPNCISFLMRSSKWGHAWCQTNLILPWNKISKVVPNWIIQKKTMGCLRAPQECRDGSMWFLWGPLYNLAPWSPTSLVKIIIKKLNSMNK